MRKQLFGSVAAVIMVAANSPKASAGDFQYCGLNWSNCSTWGAKWVDIAKAKIANVRANWKQIVLWKAIGMATGGATRETITAYLRGQGMFCPDKPWWLPLPPALNAAWPIITCAHFAQ